MEPSYCSRNPNSHAEQNRLLDRADNHLNVTFALTRPCQTPLAGGPLGILVI